ncbi:MAG: hypothetical protein KJ645_01375, partial [Planctomycetes bacterium]|nr:hypothetical protein [Planctomycetota bacterium]
METSQKKTVLGRAVIMLGMHRSGTSAFMRGLSALGVELGEHLSEPGSDNPKGFYEDLELKDLNEDILQVLGLKWHSLRQVNPELLRSPVLDTFRTRAARILTEHFQGYDVWGFKDPRTSRLLPFWKTVFSQMGIETSYVIAVRNPVSVARSLQRRNKFAEEKSYLLWLGHVLQALRETRGEPTVVLDYDLLFQFPGEELRRAANTLILSLNEKRERLIDEYANTFLDSRLRHTSFTDTEGLVTEGVSSLASSVYEWLQYCSKKGLDRADSTDWEALNQYYRDFINFSSLFVYLDALDDAVSLSTFNDRQRLEGDVRD